MDIAGAMKRLVKDRVATFAVLAAMALVVLDAGIVNIALPFLAGQFHAAEAEVIMVVSAYQAALLAGLLPSAHLAERFGYRRLFTLGILLFSSASILCSAAPSLAFLIVARFVQGIGGAAIMALGIALLRATLGDGRLGAAIAWNALTVALCSAMGPAIGAVLVAMVPWRILFVAGLPIAIAAVLAARALPHVAPTRHAVDARAIGLHGTTVIIIFAAGAFALSSPTLAIVLVAMGAACARHLAARSRSQDAPLIPFDLLRVRSFALQAAASASCFVGQAIGLVALSFQLQAGAGPGPIAAGFAICCWPLAVAASSVAANRIGFTVGLAAQCALGGIVMASGLLACALTPGASNALLLAIGPSLCGAGFGIFQLANNRALFLDPPVARAAAAGGVQGTARLAGQTAGTLAMSLIFATTPVLVAPRIGFAAGATATLLAALLSLLAGRAPARSGTQPCRDQAAAA